MESEKFELAGLAAVLYRPENPDGVQMAITLASRFLFLADAEMKRLDAEKKELHAGDAKLPDLTRK